MTRKLADEYDKQHGVRAGLLETSINAALAVVLVGLVAVHLKEFVASTSGARDARLSSSRRHSDAGRKACSVLWIGGSVLICWYIYGRAARTTVLGGVARRRSALRNLPGVRRRAVRQTRRPRRVRAPAHNDRDRGFAAGAARSGLV